MKKAKRYLSLLLSILVVFACLPMTTAMAEETYAYQNSSSLTSTFGWEGDKDAPIVFADGSYRLRDDGEKMINFGVPGASGIDWYNKEGYLPCFVSSFTKDAMEYTIENFADLVVIDGNKFEIAYSRMTVKNTADVEKALPTVSSELIPINDAAKNAATVAAHETVVRDYCIGADRFGGSYAYPSRDALAAQGDWDTHYQHMADYWNERLEGIVNIKQLPAGYEDLINAYKAGYIYTLIVKDGTGLHVGENGYDMVFDHDVIGIISTLVELGDTVGFQEYVKHILDHVQYPDARWKYSWPFALYLQKTGDTEYIKSVFETIKSNTHYIESERTGPNGTMKQTVAIDSWGYWLIDNWAALTGLTTYQYICDQLGETDESAWAQEQYQALKQGTETTLQQNMNTYDFNYLSVSTTLPNTLNRCVNPMDGNWAAQFMFGRWAWDGYLFGADQDGVMVDNLDYTYTYGFDRLAEAGLPQYTFGGYPAFSSGYNAGYASAALRGEVYRDYGIKAYQFMIDNTMSGPFSWWESVFDPSDNTIWNGTHVPVGGGSSPHMWGQSVNTKVLLDSLIAEKSDGTVIIGRGIPKEWIVDGEAVSIENVPVAGGKRMGYELTTFGATVTLELTGDAAVPVSLELLALKNNIASAQGLTFDQSTGSVSIPAGTKKAVITLKESGGSALTEAKEELAIAAHKADLMDKSAFYSYTLDSKEAFWSSLENAQAISEKADATLEEVQNAQNALKNAIDGLTIYEGDDAVMKAISGLHDKLVQVKLRTSLKDYPLVASAYATARDAVSGKEETVTLERLQQLEKNVDRYVMVYLFVDAQQNEDLDTVQESYYDSKLVEIRAIVTQLTKALTDESMEEAKIAELLSEGKQMLQDLLQYDVDYYGKAMKAASIQLDGEKDAIYDNTCKILIDRMPYDGQYDNGTSAVANMAWTDGYLYAYVDITDPQIVEPSTYDQINAPWAVDSIEFFVNFDAERDAGKTQQYRVDCKGFPTAMMGSGTDMIVGDDCNAYFSSSYKRTEAGYAVEFKIPISKDLGEGYPLYVQFMINDKHSNGQSNILSANSMKSLAWSTTLFPRVNLGGEPAKKASLEQAIAYAEGEMEKPEYANLIPAAKSVFEKALADAKAVYEDYGATQTEVNTAFTNLFEADGYLNLYKGDKAELEKLIKSAEAMELNGYLLVGQEEFKAALQNAKEVLGDENAIQSTVDEAAKNLEIAMANLIAKPDKYLLKQSIDLADSLDLSQYVDKGKAELAVALKDAKAVYEFDQATKEQVDTAASNLNSALFALRKVADKNTLATVIAKAEALNPSQYTAESFRLVTAALQDAQAKMADGSLSVDDQSKVDASAEALQKAIDQLVKASDGSSSTKPDGNNPSSGDDGKGDSTKTGDNMQITFVMFTLLLGAAFVLVGLRRKNQQ